MSEEPQTLRTSARRDRVPSSAPFGKHNLALRTVLCLESETARGRRRAGPAGLREGLFFFFMSMLSCSRIDRYWRPASWFQLHPLHFRPTLKKTCSPPSPLPSLQWAGFPLWRKGTKLFLKVKKKYAGGDYFQCIFLISSSDLQSPPASLFSFK